MKRRFWPAELESDSPLAKWRIGSEAVKRLPLPFALPILAFVLLCAAAYLGGSMLLLSESGTLQNWFHLVGAAIALVLLVVQTIFTCRAGRWYGSIGGAIAFALFLPSVARFATSTDALYPVPMAISYGIFVLYGAGLAWHDFVAWPMEAKRRGLSLAKSDQPA